MEKSGGKHYANPAYGRHMAAGEDEERGRGGGRADRRPHIHIHSHDHGHTVHVMHDDGGHEKHEFAHGDAEGIANLVHDHLGGGEEGSMAAPGSEEGQPGGGW